MRKLGSVEAEVIESDGGISDALLVGMLGIAGLEFGVLRFDMLRTQPMKFAML